MEVWKFETRRFRVSLHLEHDPYYRYDGDDPDGETQRMLDAGEYVAFDSRVVVYLIERDKPRVAFGGMLDGCEIGADSLCGSVYEAGKEREFWTAHRDPDPSNRNCTIMRRARTGDPHGKISICHYFPDMVRLAVQDARERMRNSPKLREINPNYIGTGGIQSPDEPGPYDDNPRPRDRGYT